MIEFEERTIKVAIDDSNCLQCKTKACVKGCSLYSRNVLKLRGGKPVIFDLDEAKRAGTECLACEYECRLRGFNAIRINVPISGLHEYSRTQTSR